MFYYYGRKKRLAGRYPEPKNALIMEPFAGSAAYSLHGDRWQRDVWINDLDPRVASLWRYLQQASPFDIMALPDMLPGDRVEHHAQLSADERFLISLHMNPGTLGRQQATAKGHRAWVSGMRYMSQMVERVRHWKITQLDYADLPDVEATWFIDPPYQRGGDVYYGGRLDFEHLGQWCRERPGQVIVCEQNPATWLPFRVFASSAVMGGREERLNVELIWRQG